MRGRLAAGIVAVATTIAFAAPLHAATGVNGSRPADAQTSIGTVNERRTEHGRAVLVTDPDLNAVAERHAGRMADRGEIYHNPNLGDEVDGWEALGENVGVGGSIGDIDAAFYASEGHRANILGAFTRIGVGVIEREEEIYVTQVFFRPSDSPTQPKKSTPQQRPQSSPTASPRPPSSTSTSPNAPSRTSIAGRPSSEVRHEQVRAGRAGRPSTAAEASARQRRGSLPVRATGAETASQRSLPVPDARRAARLRGLVGEAIGAARGALIIWQISLLL